MAKIVSACASRSALARLSAVSAADDPAPSSQYGDHSPRTSGSLSPYFFSNAAKASSVVEMMNLGYAYLKTESSVLFDTAAIYLTLADDLLHMEELGIKVTDDGFTRIDKNAKVIKCAMSWENMEAFEDLLVKRIIG
jgi:hypothetical protein